MVEGWRTIEASELMNILERVKSGESPEIVYMEAYANADHEYVEEED